MKQTRVFQMFDPVANHNKFWRVEWEQAGEGEVQYQTFFGRVGDRGSSTELLTASEKKLTSIIRSKEAKGYQELKLHQPDPTTSPTSNIDPEISQLWSWIHDESSGYINQYLAISIGALSQEQIDEGRKLLSEIQDAPTAQDKATMVRSYYGVIPTKLPRKIDLSDLVAKFAADEQEDRLLQLEASIANNKTAINLGVDIALLDKESDEYRRLLHYVTSTSSHGYNISVDNIFAVTIPDERKSYEQNKRGTRNRELLFHGTRNPNVRHILRSGLIVPRSASNGRMFGNGIYFANKSSKSANYCYSYRHGVPHMLFIAEVALGRVYTAPVAHGYNRPPLLHDSVLGKGGHTRFNMLAEQRLMNDEYIVYNPPQQTIKYVVTFERRYK